MLSGVRAQSGLRAAMEAEDAHAAAACFAADALLRSPLTDAISFRGREQIALVTAVVLESFQDRRYTEELWGDETGFLASHARVRGHSIEIVDRARLDATGQITELTVYCRPVSAAAIALQVVSGKLAARAGRTRGAALTGATVPFAMLARLGDTLGVRMIRPGLR